MAGHGIRMMTIVFGGMIKMIIGCLVRPLVKEVPMDMLICIMMEDAFQKYQTKNGNYGMVLIILIGSMVLIGLMLETKSKSDVAINQKVNRH